MADGIAQDQLLAVALAVEAHSDHPLASAVIVGAREPIKELAGLHGKVAMVGTA